MKKVLSLAKLSIAAVLCMAIVSCGNKKAEAEQPAESTEVQEEKQDFVVIGNPDQLLDISSGLLEYLQSAHIKDAKDAEDFKQKIDEVKAQMKEVSDSINAKIAGMTPEEKGELVSEVSAISEKIEANNPPIMKEIERLEKEAKEIGITLDVDL